MTVTLQLVRFNQIKGTREVIDSYKANDIISLSHEHPLYASGDDDVLWDIPVEQQHQWSVCVYKVTRTKGPDGNMCEKREEILEPRIYFEDLE